MRAACILILGLFAAAPLWAGLQEAGVEERTGFYVRASGGARWFNTDLKDLGLDNGSTSGDRALSGELALGLQTPSLLGFEVGGMGGAGVANLFVGPTLRLPWLGGGSRPWIHGVSLRGDYWTAASGNSGSYGNSYSTGTQSSWSFKAPAYGATATYSVERMLGRRFSLGLQAGYQWAQLEQTLVSYTYNGPPYYGSSASQQTRTVDLSGPRLALTLAFWPRPAYTDQTDRDRVARRQLARSRRQAQRYGASMIPDVPVDRAVPEVASLELPALAYGEEAMKEGRLDQAVEALSSTVRKAPYEARAWRLLGRALYLQGKPGASLEAYEAALALSPGDAALRRFVQSLRAQMP